MWNLPLRLLPLQDEVEASVGRGPGVPGRGQQDVPALALPVPSGPAHSGPLPVPELSPALPAGSAPAAASHPQPCCRPAAPLTVCNQQQQKKKTTNKYLKEYERLFGRDELLWIWSGCWPGGDARERLMQRLPIRMQGRGRVCGSRLDRIFPGSQAGAAGAADWPAHTFLPAFLSIAQIICKQLHLWLCCSIWYWNITRLIMWLISGLFFLPTIPPLN